MLKKYSHHNGYQDGSHLQPYQYQQQPHLQQSYLKQQQPQQNPQQIVYGFNQPTANSTYTSFIPQTTQQQQQQQQQQQAQQLPVVIQQTPQQNNNKEQKETKQKTNILNIYKEGKQKIMMSFYNLYRNYPTEPPTFSSTPIWMMGRHYVSKDSNINNNNSNNNNNNNNISNSVNIKQQQQQLPQQIPQQNFSQTGIFQNFFNGKSDDMESSFSNSNYNNNNNSNNNNNNNNNNNGKAIESRFISDVSTLIWFSYRKDFPPIENTNITTDIGWGCMLRTGQMILARALIKHLYKENDMISEQERKRPFSDYNQVLGWFSDYSSKEHIYGIHQIVNKKQSIEKNNRKQQSLREMLDTITSDNGSGSGSGSFGSNRNGNRNRSGSKSKFFKSSSSNNSTNNNSKEEIENNDNVEEWLSPTRISNILRQLVKSQHLEDLEMYVPTDGVIYVDYINNLCTNNNISQSSSSQLQSQQQFNSQSPPSRVVPNGYDDSSQEFNNHHPLSNSNDNNNNNNMTDLTSTTTSTTTTTNNNTTTQSLSTLPLKWKSLIIMIPLKLGVEKLNVSYIEKLKQLLKLPQSLGFIGGKPKQSFYFIGFQDDQIIYLDPHFVQESVDPNAIDYSQTYSGCVPQKMSFSQLDPSLSIGFYCRDQSSFNDLCLKLSKLESCEFPIISVCNSTPDYQIECELVDDNGNSETTDVLTMMINNYNNNVLNNNNNNHNSSSSSNNNHNNDNINIAKANNILRNHNNENIVVDDDVEFTVEHHHYQHHSHQSSSSSSSSSSQKQNQQQQQQLPPTYPPKIYTHQADFSSDGEIDDFTMVG